MNLITSRSARLIVSSLLGLAAGSFCRAGENTAFTPSPSASAPDTRYGLFGLLDRRSGYGQGVFPEPFINDDSDLEVNEFRLDWFRTGLHGDRSDELTAELEKGFGVLTVEAEFHYDWETSDGHTTGGVGNVDLGARVPFFQYVSANQVFDTTFGVGIEVGIPTNTPFSQSTEVVPKIFNDTRLGNHLTLQTIVGYSALYGGDDDGIHTLEYGITAGYTIHHKDLAIPGVQQLIPVFEIAGEKQLNKEDSGRNSITGMAGLRVNTNTIGRVQPRLGWGFVFPMNETAREDLHWGIFTSLVFEY
jgi:hypothetical protein